MEGQLTDISSFTFSGNANVRVVTLDGDPWFVGSDIRRVLGIQQGGSNWFYLDASETRTMPRGLATGRGMSQATLISESGLYKTVMRSDKPVAKPFQDWVTKVVLPSIRKDGGYLAGIDDNTPMSDEQIVQSALSILNRKLERIAAARDALKAAVELVA